MSQATNHADDRLNPYDSPGNKSVSESLNRRSPRITLATLLMVLSAPGILAELGYYLIDHELLLASLRWPVKRFVDENFLLWAAVVLPSFLVFGLCVIFKFLKWANLSRWEQPANWFAVAWAGTVLWSVLSLALYRAPYGHGPDMVGEEVSRFLIPIVVATLLSLGFATAQELTSSFRRFSLLGATAAIACIEIVVYCVALMP